MGAPHFFLCVSHLSVNGQWLVMGNSGLETKNSSLHTADPRPPGSAGS